MFWPHSSQGTLLSSARHGGDVLRSSYDSFSARVAFKEMQPKRQRCDCVAAVAICWQPARLKMPYYHLCGSTAGQGKPLGAGGHDCHMLMSHDDRAQLSQHAQGVAAAACRGCLVVLIGDRTVRDPPAVGCPAGAPARKGPPPTAPRVVYPRRTRPVPRCDTRRVPEPYATTCKRPLMGSLRGHVTDFYLACRVMARVWGPTLQTFYV
jgi:hypothetical protein